jgi:rhamnosyl/mannosyltransferase
MDDIQLDLVGQGDEDTHLKALTKKLGADDKVCFHGHLSSDDLARQFTRCDCVCLPSIERTEAFGLVLLEAMYFGKATIASDVPGSGMGWIVDQGVTGLKTTPGNVDELLGALQLLQQNRDKIDTLGKNGSKKFDQYFHINRSSEQIARLYQRVLYDNRALPE